MNSTAFTRHHISGSDQLLIAAMENCHMQLAEFSHEIHVRLAYCYLTDHDFAAAVKKMQITLIKFLNHHGVSSNKFHVTLTQGWVHAIKHFMHNSPVMNSADEFIDNNPVLLNKNILLSHYSHELLFSDQARKKYVHPDLNPFPEL